MSKPVKDEDKVRKEKIHRFPTSWGYVSFKQGAFKRKGAKGCEAALSPPPSGTKSPEPAKPNSFEQLDYRIEMVLFAEFAKKYYCKGKLPYYFDTSNGFTDFTGYGEPIMFRTEKDFYNERAINLRFAWYCWLRGKTQ